MPLANSFPCFPPKCFFLEKPAILRGGDPSQSIPHPQKPLSGSHFHGSHGHGSGAKRQNHGCWYKGSKEKWSIPLFVNATSTRKNDPRSLILGSKYSETQLGPDLCFSAHAKFILCLPFWTAFWVKLGELQLQIKEYEVISSALNIGTH